MQLRHDIPSLARNFQIFADFQSAEPYGAGHINDTYAATYNQGGKTVRYIHQRINPNIFKNAAGLMENIYRVTDHLRRKLADQPDVTRRTLTLVPAKDGRTHYVNPAGECWRTYVFIENARSYDAVESPKQAYEAAKAFGRFQGLLADLPAPPLIDTIPDFHNTPKRFASLEQAIATDAANRVALARPEIDFALSRKPITSRLVELQSQGVLPERTTHNDTKFNNVMLDNATQEGLCVIDLDTVMPGLALYDFGDMVRTTTSPALEDEKDLSKVSMQFPMFEALVRGYLSSAGGVLNQAELDHLAFSGKLISFEIGIRFLADFLAGDVYFKVHREGHNLDRCRTQFKLVESIENQEEAMNRLVRLERRVANVESQISDLRFQI
jgi:Ser/Thr protein kinase RdoA (MazF antagonist)